MKFINASEIVAKAREHVNESLTVFGERLGVTRTTVHRWETGAREPSVRQLNLLLEKCNLTLKSRAFKKGAK